MKSGSLNLLDPSRPRRPVTGIFNLKNIYVIYPLFWGVPKHRLCHHVNMDLKEVLDYACWVNLSQDIAQFQSHAEKCRKIQDPKNVHNFLSVGQLLGSMLR